IGTWSFTYTVPGVLPCATSSATITVLVGSGGAAGQDSALTVCGSITSFDLFTALAGDPQPGGTWSDPTGTGALGAGGMLDVSALPIGGASPYVYTINDPTCGPTSAVVLITAAPYPVAGIGSSLTLCADSPPVDLFSALGGDPDIDGSWTDPSGQAHGDSFIPGTHQAGDYTYTVAGSAPCPDATAVVSITVNAPPDAGSSGRLLACDTVQALDLFEGLQGAPQQGGAWQDLDGSGGLTGGLLNTTGLAPGLYSYRYTLTVPGCAPASAEVAVEVVGGVDVVEVSRECITRDRTYVVRFTIEQGDPATYAVRGLEGAISAGPPYVFTSAPIFTSESFEAFVRDRYGCSEVRVAGGTPCEFTSEIFMPESFSPNGDGRNDTWEVPGIQ
ncbi:MAG: hypothetical protein ACK4L7_09895, partial [Flavobacteriales bacterium]